MDELQAPHFVAENLGAYPVKKISLDAALDEVETMLPPMSDEAKGIAAATIYAAWVNRDTTAALSSAVNGLAMAIETSKEE